MSEFGLGALLWTQATTWPELRDAALRIDAAGYDHLWFYDHLYAINTRDPYLPIHEGWSLLAAMFVLFIAGVGITYWAEARGNPAFVGTDIDSMASNLQTGGNMEGKEVRFGIANSSLFATITSPWVVL